MDVPHLDQKPNCELNPSMDVVKDVIMDLESLLNNPNSISGIPSGFVDLDRSTCGFQKSHLYVISGAPSVGKTAFLLNAATHAVLVAQKTVWFVSNKNASADLLRKALSAAARIPLHTFYDGKMTVEELYRLYPEAAHFQTDKWQFMSNPCLTHQQLKEKCASGEKPDMLIIDDFDLLNSENTFFNRITHLNELGLSLKKLSLELNIPILISTNVNEALETRPDKRPRPHDLPDKGLLYHYANMILFLFREEIYWKDTIDKGIAEIIITKNDKGVTDTLHLAFQQEFGSFHNLATI